MDRFGRKINGALKKVTGSSSSRSRGSSSAHFTEPDESPMHEEEEATPTEEAQAEPMDVEDDAPYLDLEGDQEVQAYNLVKNREFIHMVAYDPDLLAKIGMDAEFFTAWKDVGWENTNPVWEEGSHLLTIEFLCSLQEVKNGITFFLFEIEHFFMERSQLALRFS